MIKSIDHIAIKVQNLEPICRAFASLGVPCTDIEQYDEVGLKIAFLASGETAIELLEVTSQKSPVAHDKNGLHHMALKTDDIEKAHQGMKKNDKFRVEGEIRKGAHDRRIFFFKIKNMEDVLFEYVE